MIIVSPNSMFRYLKGAVGGAVAARVGGGNAAAFKEDFRTATEARAKLQDAKDAVATAQLEFAAALTAEGKTDYPILHTMFMHKEPVQARDKKGVPLFDPKTHKPLMVEEEVVPEELKALISQSATALEAVAPYGKAWQDALLEGEKKKQAGFRRLAEGTGKSFERFPSHRWRLDQVGTHGDVPSGLSCLQRVHPSSRHHPGRRRSGEDEP